MQTKPFQFGGYVSQSSDASSAACFSEFGQTLQARDQKVSSEYSMRFGESQPANHTDYLQTVTMMSSSSPDSVRDKFVH